MTAYHRCGAGPLPLSRSAPGGSGAPAGPGRGNASTTVLTALLVVACLLPLQARAQQPAAAAPPSLPAPTELGFIEWLYEHGEDFRAESEALGWLHAHEADPAGARQRAGVEVLRAKLYYRRQRLPEAELMLRSALDRAPPGPAAQEAREVLAYTVLHQGRAAEAQALLGPVRLAGLPPLNAPAPPQYDPGRAVAWSTALPGAGFFALGEPAQGATALSLNVLMITGAVLSAQQNNPAAALLFLVVELALYQGGRDAVREEAQRLAQRWREEQDRRWLDAAGEPQRLSIGMAMRF